MYICVCIYVYIHVYMYRYKKATVASSAASAAAAASVPCQENRKEGESLQRQMLYECAPSTQAGSPWFWTSSSSARGEPETHFEHICRCVFTFHIYTSKGACTRTHTYTF